MCYLVKLLTKHRTRSKTLPESLGTQNLATRKHKEQFLDVYKMSERHFVYCFRHYRCNLKGEKFLLRLPWRSADPVRILRAREMALLWASRGTEIITIYISKRLELFLIIEAKFKTELYPNIVHMGLGSSLHPVAWVIKFYLATLDLCLECWIF